MKLETNEQSTCINKTKYDIFCSTTNSLTLYNTGDWTHECLTWNTWRFVLGQIDNNVEIHVRDSSAKMSSELHQNLTQQSKVLCILECWECSFHLEMTAFCRIRFFLRTSEFHLEQVGLMTSSRLCDVWKPSSWLSASVSISIFWTISFSMS